MTEEEAKRRFIMLNVVRLLAVVLVMLGAYIFQKQVFGDDSALIGGIFMVFGAADFFLAPMVLKKLWQKQQP
jgi:type IV secretory pathway VirB2 component (pilin)